MKKLKLIYNPFSGDKTFKFDLDVCIKIFQSGGYEVHVFRAIKNGDIERHIAEMDDCYEIVVASGGDGTVNIVVNAIMKRGLNCELGIIPSGTANDFASFLNFKPGELDFSCKAIINNKPRLIDVGRANERYFVNVWAGGLLSNVSQHMNTDFKNAFGKLAYYMKGIEQIPSYKPIPLRITSSGGIIEEELLLFMVLNSGGAGSFDKLAPNASISDGYLDFVGIRNRPIYELPMIFYKILRGEHVGDNGIVYFRDTKMRFECLSDDPILRESNVDGEAGPDMPVDIEILPKALKIITNFK